jgi:hypothetical protein
MPTYPKYFAEFIARLIVKALYDAYENNRLNYDPTIGNSPTSYGVSVWQSLMFYLEDAFGIVIGAEVFRSGSSFHITLSTCRVSFYKFGSGGDSRAEDFRLDGQRSRKRQSIVENNQLSLFNYTMTGSAQPVNVPELVVVHSGNPFAGMLEVHVGAPISSERAEDGWLWLDKVYDSEQPNAVTSSTEGVTPPTTPTFREMSEPEVDVELHPERKEHKSEDNA